MPQSLSHILLHIIFSTKDRVPHLSAGIRPDLHAYLAGTVRDLGCECYRVGGTADHVHLAIQLPRTLTVAKVIEILKSSSSKWIKTKSPALENFAWQRGYGAFSISHTHLDLLIQYIDGQEEHHQKVAFQEEYLALLKKLGVKHDKQYLWD